MYKTFESTPNMYVKNLKQNMSLIWTFDIQITRYIQRMLLEGNMIQREEYFRRVCKGNILRYRENGWKRPNKQRDIGELFTRYMYLGTQMRIIIN